MTVSLPREMIQEVERVRKTEHRTRSELIREALRVYIGQAAARVGSVPVFAPTAAERRAITKGRAQVKRGETYSIDELFSTGVADRRRATGKKTRRARA
jgi:Arc/MetJ-type ribon-helix-helix transcriptional regulator